jgi:hypothetical protein
MIDMQAIPDLLEVRTFTIIEAVEVLQLDDLV